ncbi:10547_t:CDS:2, partial [Scutellospora calospora]
ANLPAIQICTEHKKFRLELIRDLIKDATSNPLKRTTRHEDQNSVKEKAKSTKKYKVSGNFQLPLNRFVGEHFPEYKEKRDSCLW